MRSRDYQDVVVLIKKCFPTILNIEEGVFKSLWLKDGFEKLRLEISPD